MDTHKSSLSSPSFASSSTSPYCFSDVHGPCHDPDEMFTRGDLSTDLRLGLSISPPQQHALSSASSHRLRENGRVEFWPIIKPPSKSLLPKKVKNTRHAALFVKVYMESNPIGRKLDLLAHNDYNDLVSALQVMFRTSISCPSVDADLVHSEKTHSHVLTYEDREGDWMMVGDVPWGMFLSSVKRLKITRAERC